MTTPRNDRLIREICEYIEKNLHRSLTVLEIASRYNYSRVHLNRLFKLRSGVPVSMYIQSRKVAFAKRLLLHSDMSVTEIARALGYEYENHFTRMFKNACGTSPKNYRAAGNE